MFGRFPYFAIVVLAAVGDLQCHAYQASSGAPALASATGGYQCAACTIVVGLTEQLAELHNTTVEKSLEELCSFLPGELPSLCTKVITVYGEAVVRYLEEKETPDVICHAIGYCKTPPGKAMCHAFPLPQEGVQSLPQRVQHLRRRAVKKFGLSGVLGASDDDVALPGFCALPLVDDICKMFERWHEHLPAEDADGDRFSDMATARGSSWRGKDCDDNDKTVYPGRKPLDGDAKVDSNCNGIFGVDEATGRTYEDLWCNGTMQYGAMLIGDSIGAHFHIPPEWMNVTEIGEKAFEHLLFVIENELDWPQLSFTTGHRNTSAWSYIVHGPMDSLYQRMLERNRCGHRDYQNLGVNGATAAEVAERLVETMSRRPDVDAPLLAVLELVGNDVCSHVPGLGHMTAPDVYRAAQLRTLRYIDEHAPAGSHLLVGGLVDGRFLYDTMHARVHPFGALRNDVTYSAVYAFMNCLGISPCWGWLNNNASVRNATTEHAYLLNAQLKSIVETERFRNIDLIYDRFDMRAATKVIEKQGGHAWQLIEPVDGFHANQLANSIVAGLLWQNVTRIKPGWLPPANPHNLDIVKKFGDQGGY